MITLLSACVLRLKPLRPWVVLLKSVTLRSVRGQLIPLLPKIQNHLSVEFILIFPVSFKFFHPQSWCCAVSCAVMSVQGVKQGSHHMSLGLPSPLGFIITCVQWSYCLSSCLSWIKYSIYIHQLEILTYADGEQCTPWSLSCAGCSAIPPHSITLLSSPHIAYLLSLSEAEP